MLDSRPSVSSPERIFTSAGFASLVCAACFAVGFVMIFWISPGIHQNPAQRLEFILTNGLFFQLWYLVIFVAFGICLLVLINGLKKWMEPCLTLSYHLATVFGFIWASYTFSCGLIAVFTIEYLLSLPTDQQSSVWYVIYAIQIGLGDGVEWVGGIWLLTSSWHLLHNHRGPSMLHKYGLLVGGIGCLNLVPALAGAGVIFGLSQIGWFCWTSLTLFALARNPAASA